MRVAVTDGSGQLGTLVLRKLAADRAVRSMVSFGPRPPTVASTKIETVQGDAGDARLAARLAACDALVHIASGAISHPASSEARAIQVAGARNALAAAAAAGVKAIVDCASLASQGAPQLDVLLDGLEAEHPSIAVSRLRAGILVGRAMEHPLGRTLRGRRAADTVAGTAPPIVWDEDVADAVALCLKRRARGEFDLVADAPPRSPARTTSEHARRELGWSPRCPTAAEVIDRFASTVPERFDPRLATFFGVVAVATRFAPPPDEPTSVRATIHLLLTGRGGGDVTLAADGRGVRIRRGVPDAPTAVLTLSDATLIEALAGRADLATAQLTGKLRVEGEAMAAMALMSLVQNFRDAAARAGVGGFVARRLARWIASVRA